MTTVAAIAAILAGLLHVMIFVFESVMWSRPTTWRRFGVRSQADADVLRPMALNQGFYNLFLGIGALVGAVLLLAGQPHRRPHPGPVQLRLHARGRSGAGGQQPEAGQSGGHPGRVPVARRGLTLFI